MTVTDHPSGPTVESALAYVRDTAELRTPIERRLAAEVETLRAAYASSVRRQAEQDAELLVTRDAAARATAAADEAGSDYARLVLQVGIVVDRWRATSATTRANLEYHNPGLVSELDELAERV